MVVSYGLFPSATVASGLNYIGFIDLESGGEALTYFRSLCRAVHDGFIGRLSNHESLTLFVSCRGLFRLLLWLLL